MRKVSKYQKVTSESFKRGAIYTLYNAFELHGDAQIMESLGRSSRVYSLMKLALEEVSKSLILLELAMYDDFDIDCERRSKLYEAIEFHNDKTEYAFNFLISRQTSFIRDHPNPEVRNEEPIQNKVLDGLREMLSRVKELDIKKNTNLYTSLFETEFRPPFLSFEEQDIEDIRHLTYQLLVHAKAIILEINDTIFESSDISKEVIEKLDAYQQTRDMGKLIASYLNQM